MTKMKMMTRAEKEGVRERERERETERREGRKKRGETERQNTDMDPKHLCSYANHFQNHKRLLVPRSKQALSRRSNHPKRAVLGGSSVLPAEELLVREHHARQVQGLQMPFFATDREHAHALQHVTANVQSCQATSHWRS